MRGGHPREHPGGFGVRWQFKKALISCHEQHLQIGGLLLKRMTSLMTSPPGASGKTERQTPSGSSRVASGVRQTVPLARHQAPADNREQPVWPM